MDMIAFRRHVSLTSRLVVPLGFLADPMNPPFRAEHIGSFIRPPELLRARAEHEAGRLSDGELRAAEDAAIRDFGPLQRRLGFRVAPDGESRRSTHTAKL